MAKDLPYFKFFCSEWNDGDITLEDYNIQGIFINVCSYYWSKECNLESKLLYKRFKDVKTEIDLLVSENHIKVKSGYVVISFLDEQKEDREASRAIKVKGGKASVEARKLKGQQLYVIECYNNNERFIKVGVTKDSVSRRYSGSDNKTMPYKYNILGQYLYVKGNIYPTELETIIESRVTKYIPKINFKGYTECYNLDKADQIDEILKESTGKGLSSTGIQQELNSSSTQVQVLREEKRREEEIREDVLKDNTQFTEQEFLQRWKDARLFYDKKPTHISKLKSFESINFIDIKKTYTRAEIEQAMTGMFEQSTFPSTRLRPSHFLELEHFEKYLTCFTTKEKLFNKPNKQITQRI